ncbi:hypothetical protein WMY93_002759 [Mugilogobius chulae]|uniref:Fibronectin type-III domain-containing protein n=1 Tax=Mugilogobius chulae TaxID=88201 RepID=A0AAW0PWA8_9GOBI
MHPPSTPNVSSTVNTTQISWSLGSPWQKKLKKFDFDVQIKQTHQSWDEVKSQRTKDQKMIIWQKLKGHLQVRVRVKCVDYKGGHWSDWSPIRSWAAEETMEKTQDQAPAQQSVLVFLPLALGLGLSFVSVLTFYRFCVRKRLLKEKTVPNPSKYFCTLHSVHGGNFKNWLNPVSMSFVSRPCEDICTVEVCDSWDAAPSSSPCSSSALIHSPSAGNPLSSCSSSCFSNMDYFMSSSNSSSTQTGTGPYFNSVQFGYQGNAQTGSSPRKLHLSLCPSFISSSVYKSLQREPQSPDSGFGVGRYEEQDVEVVHNNQSSPLLLHLPLPASSLSPASPSDESLVFDNQALEEEAPVVASPAVSGHLSGWPETEPMCRASSLPVDTCKSGYLTLKELHTTFSNKSI